MTKRETAVARAAARAYWHEEDARTVVDAWERSGVPLSAFAESHAVDRKRLARWAKRLQATRTEPMRFHAVRLAEARQRGAHGDERIEVILSDGCTVRLPRGFAPGDLRQVLDVLEGRA
ncbi:MAG: hypothetical protein L0271_01595 [Gemmatimonadetes bacterium]|nr:hypothetical protein [Gemmatimonadota bacterium]